MDFERRLQNQTERKIIMRRAIEPPTTPPIIMNLELLFTIEPESVEVEVESGEEEVEEEEDQEKEEAEDAVGVVLSIMTVVIDIML